MNLKIKQIDRAIKAREAEVARIEEENAAKREAVYKPKLVWRFSEPERAADDPAKA
jgi:hypothetical protein